MVIDFHTHIFPDEIAERTIALLEKKAGLSAATNGTLQGLIDSMDAADVSVSVLQPVVTKVSQFQSINHFAAKINEEYQGKLLSFGGIHPDSEDYKKDLRTIKELGLAGIKIHPDYQGVMIDDTRYMNIIEYANELGLIILTHAGVDIGMPEPVHCPPDKMREVIDKLKPEKMVVAHYGGWKQWQMVYEYLAGTNIYLDTAFTLDLIENELFFKILEKHGDTKILFATDSPWSGQKQGIECLKKLPMKEETIQRILYKNAKELLNL